MNAKTQIGFTLAVLLATAFTAEGKPAGQPCVNPAKGEWKFGRAPKGCDLSSLQSSRKAMYGSLVFDERANQATSRYMQEMYSFLRESSDFYLNERVANPSDSMRRDWRRAVMAMAHQESYWTHYRIGANQKWKLMRGDGGHGYGIFQVDDRWHRKMIAKGQGEDLAGNLMYGMDMFYQSWNRALKARCVKAGDVEARARTAYAIYNGGPKAACRWTRPKAKFARNDRGFREKYRKQEWNAYVSNPSAASSVSVACLVDGGGNCGSSVTDLSQRCGLTTNSNAQVSECLNHLVVALRSRRNEIA